ncbi:MAG: antirestriction protein ArdC [Gemmatimonadetes bacterium]|nr:antirestriction protein ArdC [Gemmatimonadota bacterium]
MPANAKQQTAKPDLYETVTARIIAELERGAAPWVQPWSQSAQPMSEFPRNGKTGNFYQGNNIMLLWLAAGMNGYTSHEWFGYVQAQELGGQVRAGEKATYIFHSGTTTDKKDRDDDGSDDSTQEPGKRRYVRTLAVFNRQQIDGLPEPTRYAPAAMADRLTDVERFLDAVGAPVREGGNHAVYNPTADVICMPPLADFDSLAHYYAARFHETAHWTGHRSRLDRFQPGGKGTPAYAREELTAELAAAFLCAAFGIDGDLRHPGYIDHYMQHLREDKTAFFRASTAARQAVEYLFRLSGRPPATSAAQVHDTRELACAA